jgi:hypothetical protein
MRKGIILIATLFIVATCAFSETETPKVKHGRIDIGSKNVSFKLVKNCSFASWVKDKEAKKRYIVGVNNKLSADEWKEFEMEFIPESDGEIVVYLRGMWFRPKGAEKNIPVWIYFDEVEVEGADIENSNFEETDEKGKLKAWNLSKGGAEKVEDEATASSGQNCVKVWHNSMAYQKLKVKKDQPVKIKAKMKAAE